MRIDDLRTLISVYDEHSEEVEQVKKTDLDSLNRNSLVNKLTGVTMRKLKGRANPQTIREIFKYDIMEYC